MKRYVETRPEEAFGLLSPLPGVEAETFKLVQLLEGLYGLPIIVNNPLTYA